MPLSPGARLGAYKIIGPIGAGGMGEVYKAHDPRLGRDVAIKVLPAILAADPEALARFEREMKTLASLSHPHILAIHDVGRDEATAYAVTELLEGEPLSAIVARGPVPVRKAIEYGIQIARGLAAAHDRGIVHRDLKPANVFVQSDGHVKVLDFGLARAAEALAAAGNSATQSIVPAGTSPGMVMGTVGYMSPEQARGLPVDHRSDIFAFGCVMYEMVSGRRAFQRDSTADTLSAILKEDPPPLTAQTGTVPPALDRVIQRCLEKNPAERFQSARDLAFALDALTSVAPASGSGPAIVERPRGWRRAGMLAAAAAALAAMFLLGRALAPAPPSAIVLTQLSFGRGTVRNARFAPGGDTVVYGAAWSGAPLKLFLARTDTGESKALDVPDGDIAAMSPSGQLALALAPQYQASWTRDATLARSELFSSSVREVLDHVREADFLPKDAFAIVRRMNGRDRLEVPQGHVVFETAGYISHVRVAPDGRRVGFLEHPVYGDNRGYVDVYDGKAARRLTAENGGLEGLAWSADGREIWFTGGNLRWDLLAVDAAATTVTAPRLVWRVPGSPTLMDVDASGRVLLTSNDIRGALRGATHADPTDRDLSWGLWPLPADVSRDGTTLLATAIGRNPAYDVAIRKMNGAAAFTVGIGRAEQLSPDGKWALAIVPTPPQRVMLYPTGAGEARTVDVGDLFPVVAVFVPGGFRVAVVGTRAGSPAATLVDINTGRQSAIDISTLAGRLFGGRRYPPTYVSPDGSLLAISTDDGKIVGWTLPAAAAARELASLAANEVFAGWSADPARIYVAAWNGPKARVDALDITTGQRSTVREIATDGMGMLMTTPDLFLSADAGSYVYGFTRMESTLYMVTGLR